MTRCELPKRSQIVPLPTEAIVNQTDEFPLQPQILRSACHTRARKREISRRALPDSPNIFFDTLEGRGPSTQNRPPALSARSSVNPFGQKPNRNARIGARRHNLAMFSVRHRAFGATVGSSKRVTTGFSRPVAELGTRNRANRGIDSKPARDIRAAAYEGLAETRMLPSSYAYGRARTGGESRTT